MKVADVMGLAPASIAMPECDDATIESGLIRRFVDEKMEGSGMTKSAIVEVVRSNLELQTSRVRFTRRRTLSTTCWMIPRRMENPRCIQCPMSTVHIMM